MERVHFFLGICPNDGGGGGEWIVCQVYLSVLVMVVVMVLVMVLHSYDGGDGFGEAMEAVIKDSEC